MLKKAIISLLLVVLLVATVFPVSASSASWTSVSVTTSMEYGLLHTYNTEAGISFVEPYAYTGSSGTNCEWKFLYNTGGSNNVRAFCRPVDKPMTIRAGDVINFPYISGGFGGWFGGDLNSAKIRWTVIAFDDTNSFPRWDTVENDFVSCVTGNEEWHAIAGGANWNYTVPATTFQVVRDCNYAYLGLEIVFDVKQNFTFSMNKKTFTVGYGNYAVYEQLQAQKETNDKLDDLLEQPEKEKEEADDTGNSVADSVLDAIPGDTEGFTAGLRSFASALSYSGTNCAWTLPAITLPAIEGVMPEMRLTDEQPINFAEWVQKMPANVLEIVQLVLTIALVVYCFKELYSTIAYFLTLKGGDK